MSTRSPEHAPPGGGKVLLVEDDEELRDALEEHLREEGFVVEIANHGGEVLELMLNTRLGGDEERIGAVVLDLLIPVLNGREVCHRLRAAGCWVPVIMATAYGELEDRIAGFEDGADDYLVKPFSLVELTVRLRAMLRRAGRPESQHSLGVGELCLDLETKRVHSHNASVQLSPRECEVLRVLMEHPGVVLRRQSIVAAVWGKQAEVSTNLLDQYIARLRKKLDALVGHCDLETEPRVGYRLRMRA